MTKALSISMLAMFLMAAADSAAIVQEKRPISQESFERRIQNEPLVFQGKVTKVRVKLMPWEELFGGDKDDVNAPATEITMKIERIFAGDYDGNEIRVFLREGKTEHACTYTAGWAPIKVKVGDHAVVAIEPHSRETGLNIIDRWEEFFRVEGTKLVPYREELYLAVDEPFEILEKKARERELPEVFRASDLVCTGTVRKMIDLNSPSRRFVVSIDETLKGEAEQSEITVAMSKVSLPWKLWEPGFRVFLFLQRDGAGYRPAAGVCGYYVMDGERLTRGHGTPIKMTASRLKSDIKMWKEAQR